VVVSGGTKNINGNVLTVANADSVTLLTRTDKYYADCETQWDKQNLQKQLAMIPANYNTLLKGQIATHEAIYDRVKLDLNADAADRSKTNEELLAMQKTAATPVKALWERVFDAGRYYYLSSSSELTPPDLLGIWTGDCNAGWGGFYHLDANVNLQVAGGNIGDMPEAMEGYFKLNEGWKTDLETNARKLLGCRGMLAAGNSPGTSSGLMANINDYYPYQYATGEEGWLLYPFWEHYLITGDKVFLKTRLYPLLKDMGYFYEDFLTHTDANGKYIFAGSVSPENQPANLKVSLLNNSGFDISGAKFALTALVETCKILGLDQGKGLGFEKWSAILGKLPPYLINSDGAIQEWSWPGLADHYNHRHSSHMLPVWPFREITPENDQTLFNAAVTTLAKKDAFNYENAGHGLLHSALIAANLKNAQAVANKLLRLTKEDFYFNSLATAHYPKHNTFCTDVCNTVPAIMMEMLVGSSPGILELLPALPKELDKGTIAGIKGRNRVTVKNLSWNMANKTVNCTLVSAIDQKITLIERQGISAIKTVAKNSPSSLGYIVQLRAGVKTNIAMLLK
jgi:alpha-L-fucosidase 2